MRPTPQQVAREFGPKFGWHFVEDRLVRKLGQSSERLVTKKRDCAAGAKKVEGPYPLAERRRLWLASVARDSEQQIHHFSYLQKKARPCN